MRRGVAIQQRAHDGNYTVRLMDLHDAFDQESEEISSDVAHYNERGQQMIADLICDELAPMLAGIDRKLE
jgi:hypothetical protein